VCVCFFLFLLRGQRSPGGVAVRSLRYRGGGGAAFIGWAASALLSHPLPLLANAGRLPQEQIRRLYTVQSVECHSLLDGLRHHNRSPPDGRGGIIHSGGTRNRREGFPLTPGRCVYWFSTREPGPSSLHLTLFFHHVKTTLASFPAV